MGFHTREVHIHCGLCGHMASVPQEKLIMKWDLDWLTALFVQLLVKLLSSHRQMPFMSTSLSFINKMQSYIQLGKETDTTSGHLRHTRTPCVRFHFSGTLPKKKGTKMYIFSYSVHHCAVASLASYQDTPNNLEVFHCVFINIYIFLFQMFIIAYRCQCDHELESLFQSHLCIQKYEL